MLVQISIKLGSEFGPSLEEILDNDNIGETTNNQDIQDVFYTASAKAFNPADHDQAQALQEALKVLVQNIRETQGLLDFRVLNRRGVFFDGFVL